MILVDTSVWVELLNGSLTPKVSSDELLLFVTCGPIVQEVLQGLRAVPASEAFREAFLAIPCLSDPLSMAVYLSASDIYRQGRSRGYTIRSSTDCLIAAIAMEHRVPVWHRDRDFQIIARYTSLKTGTQLHQVRSG